MRGKKSSFHLEASRVSLWGPRTLLFPFSRARTRLLASAAGAGLSERRRKRRVESASKKERKKGAASLSPSSRRPSRPARNGTLSSALGAFKSLKTNARDWVMSGTCQRAHPGRGGAKEQNRMLSRNARPPSFPNIPEPPSAFPGPSGHVARPPTTRTVGREVLLCTERGGRVREATYLRDAGVRRLSSFFFWKKEEAEVKMELREREKKSDTFSLLALFRSSDNVFFNLLLPPLSLLSPFSSSAKGRDRGYRREAPQFSILDSRVRLLVFTILKASSFFLSFLHPFTSPSLPLLPLPTPLPARPSPPSPPSPPRPACWRAPCWRSP